MDIIGFDWGLPHTVAPHPDDVAKPTLWAMQDFFLEPTKYPKVHQLTLGAAYAPYLSYLWAIGGLDISGSSISTADSSILKNPLSSITNIFRIARGVNVILHIGLILLLYFTVIHLTGSKNAALVTAAMFGLSPCAVLFSRMTNVDLPMTFWFGAAALAYFKVLEHPSGKRLTIFSLLCVLAVCTKEQIAFVLLPMIVHGAFITWFKGPDGALNGFKKIIVALCYGLLLYALLQGIFWDPVGWFERLGERKGSLFTFVEIRGGRADNFIALLSVWLDTFIRFPWTAGLGGSLLITLAVLLAARRPTYRGMIILNLFVFYIAVTFWFTGFAQFRYVIPAIYIGSILVGYQIGAILRMVNGKRNKKPFYAVLVFALFLNAAHSLLLDTTLLNDTLSQTRQWLSIHVTPGSTMEIYSNENYLPPLRSDEIEPVRIHDFSTTGFMERKPDFAIITDGYNWDLENSEIEYLEWLKKGPKGYDVFRFGPHSNNAPVFHIAPEIRNRICANMAILVRKGSKAYIK